MIGDPVGAPFPGGALQADQYKINSIYDIHPTVLGDLAMYLGGNVDLLIPNIDQVPGYSAQTPYQAPTISAEQTTTSTAFVDLATIGPQLTGLPDGQYTITWGAAAKISSANTRAVMSVSLNGAAASLSFQAYTSQTAGMAGISYSMLQTLQGQTGGNSIVAKYCIGASGATATFGSRWLIAIRVSGP